MFFYLFYNTANVFYVMRFFILLLFMGNLYFVYKIGKISGFSDKISLIAVFLFVFFAFDQRSAIEFRPDNLMLFCFLFGIYYLFAYINDKKLYELVLSFIGFLFSFFALQKSIVLLVTVFFLIVYLMIKKQICVKNVLLSLQIPVLLVTFWLVYLYKNDALQIYWETAFLLNSYIVFDDVIIHNYSLVYIIFAFLLSLYVMIFDKNFFVKVLALFSVFFILIMRSITVVPFAHYFLPVYALDGLIVAKYVFNKVYLKKYFDIAFFSCVMIIYALCFYFKSFYYNNSLSLQIYVDMEENILKNSEANDLIIGCYDGWNLVGGLRKEATGFWWFSHLNLSNLYDKKIRKTEIPDLNLIVKAKKPKFVCKSSWHGCSHVEGEGCNEVIELDGEYMKKHYVDTGLIYMRK